MNKKQKLEIEISIALFILIAFTVLLYFVGATELVSMIGVRNTYLVMFLIALFGGMTSIGGVSYTTSIITFVAGGADPLLIALLAGAGTSLGDTAYFLVSREGSKIAFHGWFGKKVERFSKWLQRQSKVGKFIGIYLYTGFTPLPNDPLTITLGISKAKRDLVIPALVLGDFTIATLLAFLGHSLPFF